MTRNSRTAFMLTITLVAAVATAQETTSASKPSSAHRKRASSSNSIQEQIRALHDDLQHQIDELKNQLASKDTQIRDLRSQLRTNTETQTSAVAEVQNVRSDVQKNTAAVNTVEGSLQQVQTHNESLSATVQKVQKAEAERQKDVEQPAAIHYKGITIVPGGFLAAESIWRQRAMNADVYTNYNATPYMNSGEAHTSEWVPSARQTRLSTLFTGKTPFGTASGYFEGDFLSAGTTSNNLQTNSYTLRLRQAWGQVSAGSWKFTAGQMWTLLTENKKAADPGQEAVPLFFDGNLHVGNTYLRQLGIRLQDAITSKTTLAIALENSQYQFSASNAPSNFFFGNAGATGGLNNPLANYTNQLAPDVIAKLSFDPGYGHYEIGGVARFFRARFYPNGQVALAQNDTRVGGGIVANARFPITPKFDLGLHLVAGDGTGRYGASLLPDITVRPNGTLSPLRNFQGLLSLEYHPTKLLDLFAYAGNEYVQRTVYVGPTGTLVGYAPITANNSGCNTEAVPTAGSGFAPGASTCLGATRAVTQGSIGWLYRIYSGPAGKVQYGIAYSYLTRNGWVGVGSEPKATNNFVYTSFRYYLP